MSTPAELESCLSFIHSQLQRSEEAASFGESRKRKPAVTISRQSGCGAHVITVKLARHLQEHSSENEPPWTVFDGELLERLLQEHQLPERLAGVLPEDRIIEIADIMGELFGLHPSRTLVQQTSETILRLAQLGNVILLGRGASVLTARLPHVLHVRIVGSLERRCEHMQRFEHLDPKAALDRIRHEDLDRERYVKKHFGREANDPLLYHLIINTDLVPLDDAARLIGEAVLHRTPVAA